MKQCSFCQKDTVYVPLLVGPKNTASNFTRKFEVYYCYDCSAEFVNTTGGVHLYVNINDKMYRWSVEDEGKLGRLWYVGQPGTPGIEPNRKMFLLKTFKEDLPVITPQNIEEKLRFILVFM